MYNGFQDPNATDSRAYWLEITGDSMCSDTEMSYPAGTRLWVDPDQIDHCRDGSAVIAQLGTGELVFRLLASDGQDAYLRALNPAYPDIAAPFEIVAEVISAHILTEAGRRIREARKKAKESATQASVIGEALA